MTRSPGAPPDLSVLVLRAGRRDAFSRLVHSLQQQTLHPRRTQVLVVDGEGHTPLRDSLPADLGHHLEWVEGTARRAALAEAVDRCRGSLVLLLTSDSLAPDELLAQHLVAHESARQSGLVQGRVRIAPHRATLVTELLDRADLVLPAHLAPGGPAYALNVSLAREDLRRWRDEWRGDDPLLEERLPRTLARHAGPVRRVPEAECLLDRELGLDTCLERLQWLGHDLARGRVDWPLPFVPPGVGRPRDDHGLRQLLVAAEQRCRKARAVLRRVESEVDPVMQDRWDLRAAYLGRILEEAEPLLRELAVQEVQRGALLGAADQGPERWRAERRRCRMAACLRLERAGGEDRVRRVLDRLPEDAELVVMVAPAAAAARLPRDPRLVRVPVPEGGSASLRGCCQASHLAVLPESGGPDRSQWVALQECLRQTPGLVALRVGAPDPLFICSLDRWQEGMEACSADEICRALAGEVLEMEMPVG